VRTVRLKDARGLQWEVEAPYEAVLREAILPRLDELATARGVDVVKRNRVRTVLRIPLEAGPHGREDVYLKRHHRPNVRATLKYLVVPSRAKQEWRMALAFEDAGIPIGHPIAWAERWRFGVLRDAVFLCRGLPGAMDFVPWIRSRAPDPADVADRLRRRTLLHELARMARRQHDAGLDHRDLHSGNVLLVPDGGGREVSLHIIDLHAARKRPHPLTGRRRLRLLAKLLHSLREITDGSDRYRFLRDYAAGRGRPIPDLRESFRTVENRVARLERRRLKSRSKRCLKRSSRFDVGRSGGWKIRHRRIVSRASLVAAAAEHDRAVADGIRLVKRGKRGDVTVARMRDAAGERMVVVKETRARGFRALLGPRLGRLRGRRGWFLGNALLVRDVGAAHPLGYLVRRHGPFATRELLVMEDVSKGGERLDHHVLRRWATSGLPVEERRRLIDEVAGFLRHLHRGRVYHGDLKACNLFLQTDGEGRRIRVVDYDRVRLDRDVDFRRRVKNLAQLSASIPTCISRSDRLRFFRSYAPTAFELGEWKAFARGVEEECREKIVVGMAPIE
jgi:tRNA A-37 threonylcarbamoyl transferase component Bud32